MRGVKVIFDIKDRQLIRRTKYVFSQIAGILGTTFIIVKNETEIKNGDLVLCYGTNGRDANNYCKRFISIPNFKWIDGKSDKKGNEIPYVSTCIHYNGGRIPIWYHFYKLDNVQSLAIYESGGCAVGINRKNVYFGFDVIMCIFHLLSCQEEYLIPERDKFDRFLGAYSPRLKDNFLEQPTVNYYAMLLKQAIEGTLSINKQEYSPPHFYALLSHDVDNISPKNFWILGAHVYRLFKLIYYLDLKMCVRRFRLVLGNMLSPRNGYWNFEKYLRIERNHNAKSTFYFITGKRGRYGARYDLSTLEDVFHYLHKNGWGVGLHTNFYSYDNSEKIKKEKESLENTLCHQIIGSRNHYLRFKVPYTWRHLVKAGIKYDSTLGYPDTLGFRAGIAYPFFPYDLERDEIFPIIEIPLVIMDNALFEGLALTKQEVMERVKRLIDRVAKVDGIITILWHSEALCDRDSPEWGEVYEEILSYVEMKGGKFITGEEAPKLIRNPVQ